jgi:hypothetical protein
LIENNKGADMRAGLLLTLFLVVACKGGGGGNSSSPALVSHLGIWSDCEDYDGNDDSVNDSSLLSVVTLAEDSVALTQTNFGSTGCLSGQEEYRYSNTASYTRNANTYTTILKSDTYVSLSSGDVLWNNNNAWCGYSDWVINVPKNTLGRSCDGEVANSGDVDTYTVIRNGNTLSVGETTYELAIGTDFTPAGLTLPNGTFAYSDGVSFAALAVINSGSYSLYRYDLVSKVYNVETGTVTSSNNVANFTIIGSTPAGCNTGSASRRFTTGSLGVTMEFNEDNLIIFAQKITSTESNFRTAFLGGGFNLGCF